MTCHLSAAKLAAAPHTGVCCHLVQAAFDRVQEPQSRGELPTAFLRGDLSPEDYASSIDLEVELAAPSVL